MNWHDPQRALQAKIETQLMVEFLADEDVRPAWKDATWIRNTTSGPSPEGIRVLREIQDYYGRVHVTTGNAREPSEVDLRSLAVVRRRDPEAVLVGVYVRDDVLEETPSLFRDHVSRP